jgi:tetraacyldisaccharide 4'-kinase
MTALLDTLNPYAALMRARRAAYHSGLLHSDHPGIPVISIGNLSMGGTGKTPLTIAVAQYLAERGKRVAVVSRGYGRTTKGFLLVQEGTQVLADVERSGDEAQLVAMKVPSAIVIVDEDRAHGARQAKHLGAEVIVLDDGYQRMSIRRDMNVLVVNASKPIGATFPFGMLREPLSAARDADAIVFTNADAELPEVTESITRAARPEALLVRTRTKVRGLLPLAGRPGITPASLSGCRVLALSSIASPERFYRTLRTLGAIVVPHALRDHARFSAAEIERVYRHARSSAAEVIVTTEKDGVKCAALFSERAEEPPVHILEIEPEFMESGPAFFSMIDTRAKI